MVPQNIGKNIDGILFVAIFEILVIFCFFFLLKTKKSKFLKSLQMT